jgi:hypothetical protein
MKHGFPRAENRNSGRINRKEQRAQRQKRILETAKLASQARHKMDAPNQAVRWCEMWSPTTRNLKPLTRISRMNANDTVS